MALPLRSKSCQQVCNFLQSISSKNVHTMAPKRGQISGVECAEICYDSATMKARGMQAAALELNFLAPILPSVVPDP